ncbi:MAG TPA: hypothetical protein VIE46_13080 [Gemmatimonadales bacterium]
MVFSTPRLVAPTLALLIAAGSGCNEHTAPAYSTLVLLTSTSGTSLDPDGYLVTLTRPGGVATLELSDNGSLSVARTVGTDRVAIADISPNCTVASPPPASVNIPGDQEFDTLRVSIACVHASGAITVHTLVADSVATGPFTVVVDGTDSRVLGGHDTATFSGLADGVHTVVLSGHGVAKAPRGCSPTSDSVGIRVSGGATVETTLALSTACCGSVFECD